MEKKVNKHLGMNQDELAASFAGRLNVMTKSAKPKKRSNDEVKEEGWGLTDEEISAWNKKFSRITAKPKKNKLVVAH